MSQKDASADASIKIHQILSESSKPQPPSLDQAHKGVNRKDGSTKQYITPSKPDLLPKHLKELVALADLIKSGKASKVIVMTGAGISTAAGIPDFRTPGTGLYDNLQKYELPYAEAIFDINYFNDRPEAFFELASELYPGANYRPTWAHYFITLLSLKGLLLRNFSQNIDGLEHEAGIPSDLLIEAHGHFRTSTCISCRYKTDTHLFKELILAKQIPRCTRCSKGILKPDITFFGENLPPKFYTHVEKDFPTCDLLLIMGTSLKVAPFSTLVDHVRADVPTVLINLVDSFKSITPAMGKKSRKYDRRLVLAPCDEACWELAGLLDWQDELVDLYVSSLPDVPQKTIPDKAQEEADLVEELDKLKLV